MDTSGSSHNCLNISDLTGYYEDKDFFTTRGDARAALQLARNKYSIKLGRTNRFLIDDDDTPHKLAYQLTKPLKGNLTYNNQGTFSFTLQEVVATKYDNHELGIADYYRHFETDKVAGADDSGADDMQINSGKKVWI